MASGPKSRRAPYLLAVLALVVAAVVAPLPAFTFESEWWLRWLLRAAVFFGCVVLFSLVAALWSTLRSERDTRGRG